jgi:hypothetical protein
VTDPNWLSSEVEVAKFDQEWEEEQAANQARARRDPVFARELEIYDEFVRDGLVLLGTEAEHYRQVAREAAAIEFADAGVSFPPPPPGRLARALRRLRG